MNAPVAFSWSSELPSGNSPFWIRDEGLLHTGDAVSVDTRSEPSDGDLVVAEAEVDDSALRLARRYFARGGRVRLEPIDGETDVLDLPADSVIVMGVIRGRLRFEDACARVLEEPLPAVPTP